MDDDDEPVEDTAPQARPASAPGPMMRFIVVVTGLFTISLGRAVEHAGGVFAVTFGLLIQLVGVLIVAIAIGAIEWLVRRMRRRAPAGDND